MSKKRKTKKEKVIAQLRRQLQKKTNYQTRQEAVFVPKQIQIKKELIKIYPESSVFSYDPKLIKKDLIKTFILTTLIVCLELVLYFRLR